ncbi:hypothetical protein BYT27DRAFT_7187962, partial [Phlegmacium glaucopus]
MFSFDTSHYLFSICTVHAPEFPKLQNSSLSLGMYILPHLHPNIDSFGSRAPEFPKVPDFLLSLGMYILSHPHPNVDSFGSQLPSFQNYRIVCCPWAPKLCTPYPYPNL